MPLHLKLLALLPLDTGSTTITASITLLVGWQVPPPDSPLLGRLQGPQEIQPAVLGFTPKTSHLGTHWNSSRAARTLAGTLWGPQFWSKK